jgi:hypothetical protein
VLPKGLRRIRHYDLFANANRKTAIAKARELLAVPKAAPTAEPEAAAAAEPAPRVWPTPCPCCGKRLFMIEVFGRWQMPRYRAPDPTVPIIRIDTS